MSYAEEEYLMLSEIQHYVFCPRQWGLIHLEQHWQENILTVEGNALHERAHDENIKEKRGNKIIVRGMRVASPRIGISGVCDVVEFHADPGAGAGNAAVYPEWTYPAREAPKRLQELLSQQYLCAEIESARICQTLS